MCEPATLLTLLAVGSATTSAISGIQSANAQVDAANMAASAQVEEYATDRDQKIGERIKEARAAQARMRVSAGESGVSGNSFEAMLRDSMGATNHDLAVANKQSGFTSRRLNADLASVSASHRGIGGLNAGLQIATAGANAYRAAKT